MSISSEISRISGNISDSLDAVAAKGVTVPSGSNSDDLPGLIAQITSGGGSAISIVDTLDANGGTIRTITAANLSSDTVTASHLEYGYTAHDASGSAITGTLSPGVTPTGTINITSNGTTDVTNYASANVSVTPSLQAKTDISPTESSQTITADTGYDGLSSVGINAVSSSYVGSAIDRNDSDDLTASGATVTAPAGYYAESASKTVSSGTEGTPTATKGTVSNNSVSVTPSVTNVVGYISGGTHNGTAVTVSASELVSGTKTISASGTTDVTNYASASVAAGAVTAPSSISGSSATVSTGTNTLTLTKTVSVTPSVTTAGYISSGTAGDSSVSLTASVTVDPTPTVSGDTVTIPAGYYSEQATKSVSSMTLPTSAAASATSGYSSKATIGRSTSDQYINIPTGYNSAGAYYKVSAVANGSATGPSSLSGSSATVSTGTNTITLTKTGVTTTPTVSAGYVASATASTATVALTASVTTKAATTYHPSTTDQSIASGSYTTGTQTIKAVTHNLDATKILSGTTVKIGDSTDDDCVTSVSGSLAFQTIYSGSSAPSSSTGVNGDIYIDTSGSDITVEQLNVTTNGTYTATSGKAYSPVVVNVSGSSSETTWTDPLVPISIKVTGTNATRTFFTGQLVNTGHSSIGTCACVAYAGSARTIYLPRFRNNKGLLAIYYAGDYSSYTPELQTSQSSGITALSTDGAAGQLFECDPNATVVFSMIYNN